MSRSRDAKITLANIWNDHVHTLNVDDYVWRHALTLISYLVSHIMMMVWLEPFDWHDSNRGEISIIYAYQHSLSAFLQLTFVVIRHLFFYWNFFIQRGSVYIYNSRQSALDSRGCRASQIINKEGEKSRREKDDQGLVCWRRRKKRRTKLGSTRTSWPKKVHQGTPNRHTSGGNEPACTLTPAALGIRQGKESDRPKSAVDIHLTSYGKKTGYFFSTV